MPPNAPETEHQRAEDIAYTLNHSVYCTLTDFLNPVINAATDGYLSWLFPGCGHDHSGAHDHGHDHHHHDPHAAPLSRWENVKQASRHAFSRERFFQYVKGEFLGDFGAVPLTIAVQRLFPGFMRGVRNLSEPLMAPIFTSGVERDSKHWAAANHVALDSVEYHQHANRMYAYEMGHFPQALVWTGFSLGLNTAYQIWADKSAVPFGRKLALKSSSVLSGVLVTAGMVVAARALAPNRMHALDAWTSQNAILPTTKLVGKILHLGGAQPSPDAQMAM